MKQEAIDWAKRQKFGVNPVTGIVEILDVPTVEEHVDALVSAEPAPAVAPAVITGASLVPVMVMSMVETALAPCSSSMV